MSGDDPEYYFRVRDNGALVFRVAGAGRDRRLNMEPIAAVNVRNGEVRPQGKRTLEPADTEAIEGWIATRRATLQARDLDDVLKTAEALNLTAQWVQSRATDEDLEAVTDHLLMAMHDLRTILVRRKAERLSREPSA